jgi:RNA polymerase sigma factor (sigma-70 family)
MQSMTTSDQNARLNGPKEAFATTHWSIVVSAGRESSPDSTRALESLCQTYWQPLYAYARCRVSDTHEAQDLTQAFFAELLEKNYVGAATPERGRFRAFLVTAFKHFLSKQWEKARALKRGGGRSPLSLDFESADSSFRIEPESGLTPDEIFDRQWAIALLDHIVERLRREFEAAGKAKLFGELKAFMVGEHQGQTHAQAAARLNMTESATKKAASRMRRRYRELLREEIAQTVSDPEEVEDEIRNLFAVLEL